MVYPLLGRRGGFVTARVVAAVRTWVSCRDLYISIRLRLLALSVRAYRVRRKSSRRKSLRRSSIFPWMKHLDALSRNPVFCYELGPFAPSAQQAS